jgi:hypothetical protein
VGEVSRSYKLQIEERDDSSQSALVLPVSAVASAFQISIRPHCTALCASWFVC